MFHTQQRKEGLSAAIFGLWRNWAIAVGFITVLEFVAPLVSQQWMAPICLTAYFLLRYVRSVMNHNHIPVCSRLYQEVSVIILIFASIVVLRLLTGHTGSMELNGQPVNENGPIIGIIISAPATVLVTLIFLLEKKEPLVCQLCHLRYGNVVEHGFIGKLYRLEWRFQTKVLMALSILMTVVDWAYYFFVYINVNLNSSDIFFFVLMPLALYVASLIYLGRRYYSMWMVYCHNDNYKLVSTPGSTEVRFLVFCGDNILIDMRQTENTFNNGAIVKRFDTPAVMKLSYRERVDTPQAITLFHELTGFNADEIRPIFSSPDNVTFRNIFHFFAFIDSPDEIVNSKLRGEWLTLGMLRSLVDQRLTDATLNAELARIYNVAMAWKTYDREGQRLYKFKHYHPTFRLRDIRSWDVDYNDPHWLCIGRKNEDWKFYKLSRLFAKIKRVFSPDHSLNIV